jgi:hypothetical protein
MALLDALRSQEREPNARMKAALNEYHEAIEKGTLVVRH